MDNFTTAIIVFVVILLAYFVYHKTTCHCIEKPAPGTTTVSVTPSSDSDAQPVSKTVASDNVTVTANDNNPSVLDTLGTGISSFSNTLQRKIMGLGGAGSETYNPGLGTRLESVYHRTWAR